MGRMMSRSPWRAVVGRRLRFHLDTGVSIEGRLETCGALLCLSAARELSSGAELSGETLIASTRVVLAQVLD